MDRQQLPQAGLAPDVPERVTEIRAAERSQASQARNAREARA